jgi:hypothetical protein
MEHVQDPNRDHEGRAEQEATAHGPVAAGAPFGPLGRSTLGPELGPGVGVTYRQGDDVGSPVLLGDLGR